MSTVVLPLPARSLALADLRGAYRDRHTTPSAVVRALYARIAAHADRGIWISLVPIADALAQARALEARSPDSLPLYGIPFAIKDNMDVAGMATTAACPDFAYVAQQSAFVVTRLIDAGAIPIGKSNLDQFATGLAGTRSPFGVCRNSFNPDYISGGSSSGSAVAVALGLASFALGTDTAGSGRVPAAFNNIVGLKPTCGRLSPRGVVPASRTLDAVSILALTCEDAARICRIAEGFDKAEPYSRRVEPAHRTRPFDRNAFSFGVPRREQLQFFGNTDYAGLFDAAVARLERLGGKCLPIDFTPFSDAGKLLYEGPWVAERYTVVEELLLRSPQSLLAVTRDIIAAGAAPSAVQAFRGQYRLATLRRITESVWNNIDVLLTPTAATTYRIDKLDSDPMRLNSTLGFYANFMNFLDLAGVAVPAGFTSSGLPFGVTLVGPTWSDFDLLSLGARLQRHESASLGALGLALPEDPSFNWDSCAEQP